jgi:spore coat polysaccharide biosynthesis predicted glycosyltransferase SpsG
MPEQVTKTQTIEELRKRYEELNEKKITAAANHETAKKQLDQLKAAAKTQWGTDDLEELRKKLAEMEAENDRKRREYQTQLDKIETDLKEVDQKFDQAQSKA